MEIRPRTASSGKGHALWRIEIEQQDIAGPGVGERCVIVEELFIGSLMQQGEQKHLAGALGNFILGTRQMNRIGVETREEGIAEHASRKTRAEITILEARPGEIDDRQRRTFHSLEEI